MKRRPDVTLQIDRLVVDGVALNSRQATQLHRSVERELAAMLQRDGFHTSSGAMYSATAPSIQLTRNVQPTELGRQIAQSVYQSLTWTKP